jgi:outer membrane protein assembly factor BamB
MNISLPPSCAACDSLLPQYYDGDLEPALHAEIVDHLTHCSRCIDAVADLSVAMGALHQIPQPKLGDLPQQIASVMSKLQLAQRWSWRPQASLAAASLLLACSVGFGFWMARITELPIEEHLKNQGLIATSEGWLIPTVLGERQAGRIWLNGRWTNRTAAAEQLLSEQGYSVHTDAWLNSDAKAKFLEGEILTSSGWTTVDQLVPPLLAKQGLSHFGDSWIDAKDVQGLRLDGSLVTTDQLVNDRLIALGYVHTNDGVWRLAEEESRMSKGEVRVGETWTTVQAIAQKVSDSKALELDEEKKRNIPAVTLAKDSDAPAAQAPAAIPLGWKGVYGVPNVGRTSKPLGTATDSLSQLRAGNGGKHQQLNTNDIIARKINIKKSTDFLSASIIRIGHESIVGTPAVIAGRLHLSGSIDTVYSMDLETNKGSWQTKLSDTTPSNPVGYDESDVAYTTGSCTLYTLSGKNGAVKMNEWISSTLHSMPVTNGKLLVTTMPGWITAINGANGSPRWATPVPSEVRTGVLSVGTQLYCTTKDGTLLACEGASGKEIWRNRIGGVSSPTVRGKDLYVRRLLHNNGAIGESIAVLDSENGRIRTESLGSPRILKTLSVQPNNPSSYATYVENPEGSELKLTDNQLKVPDFGTVLISEKSTIVLSEHVVEARSVTDGQVMWQTSIPISGEPNEKISTTNEHSDPVIAGNLVILGCLDGQVRALDIATGKLLWSLNVGSAMGSSADGELMRRSQATIVSGRIYITTMAGELVVIDTGNRLLNGPRWWGDQARWWGDQE